MICTNYSLLYGHLDPEKLLPKLPEKDLISEKQLKAAKAVHQKFAKNAIIIRVLFWHDRPSHGLLKFCDTLETTPGQEHLGRKLLKGICVKLLVAEFHDAFDVWKRAWLITLFNVFSQITSNNCQCVYIVQVRPLQSTAV